MRFLRLSAVMKFPIRKYLAPALEAGLPRRRLQIRREPVARVDRGLVPRSGGPDGAGGDLAGDRRPPHLDRRPARRVGDRSNDRATTARRPRCPGIGINCASLYFGAIRRSGRGVESHDAPRSGPAGRRRSGRVFGDQAVAAAMIDRIVHHADVLTLKGAGYRL